MQAAALVESGSDDAGQSEAGDEEEAGSSRGFVRGLQRQAVVCVLGRLLADEATVAGEGKREFALPSKTNPLSQSNNFVCMQ